MPNINRLRAALRLYLALAFAEGLLVLWFFLREPSEAQSAIFLGFSAWRVMLIVLVMGTLLILAFLFYGMLRHSRLRQSAKEFLTSPSHQGWVLRASMLGIAVSYGLIFLSPHALGRLAPYQERVLPLLAWFAALAIQSAAGVLSLRGIHPEELGAHRPVLRGALALLLLFGGLAALIALTHLGLTPDHVYWQGPGTPILLQQVFLALAAVMLFQWWMRGAALSTSPRLDLLVFLALWGLACLAWLSQPARLTYFSLEPRPPNFQSYPFSDALIYDSTAQEFLIGKPIPGDFWVKPVYALFLALLHLFSDSNYTLLVSLQVVFLAVIPSFVYLLTTSLGQRSAGLLAALLVIIRERNGLALSNVIQTSHSKLLLSDVFAMGEMVILVWLVVRWLENPAERRATPVAVGGMLGLLILTRGHPILMVPFIFLIGLTVLKQGRRLWLESALRMGLGLALVLVPWFWHTYQSSGRLTFQDPSSPYAANDTLVKIYTESGSGTVPASSSAYEAFQSQAFRSVLEHPLEVAYFTASHYLHNAIFSVLYLPESFRIESLTANVKTLPFWNRWEGFFPAQSWLLMFLNVALLCLGIVATWGRVQTTTLAPILLGGAYNLSIAVARRSGWRFILPADWITLVFYAIGMIQLLVIVRAFFRQSSEPFPGTQITSLERPAPGPRKQSVVISGLPFLLIAIALVLGNRLFRGPVAMQSTGELLQEFESAGPAISETELSFLKRVSQAENGVVLQGRALYPVYLKADEGVLNFNWPSFGSKPYGRLALYLIGPRSLSVNLPMESPPARFPDEAEVIVIGCAVEAGDIDAVAIAIRGASPAWYLSEPVPSPVCPRSETRPDTGTSAPGGQARSTEAISAAQNRR